jgi:hypothetical protein
MLKNKINRSFASESRDRSNPLLFGGTLVVKHRSPREPRDEIFQRPRNQLSCGTLGPRNDRKMRLDMENTLLVKKASFGGRIEPKKGQK